MKSRTLIVEDEPGILLVLTDLLVANGHRVKSARDGRTGLEYAQAETFDLLILDIMVPKKNGLEVCQAVREAGFDGGILLLTAKGQVTDRVKGLRCGADDYLVKPFDSDELLARVDALLRRAHKGELTPVTQYRFGNVTADFGRSEFNKDGRLVTLSPREAELLKYFVNHRGQSSSRENILKQVWNNQPFITARTVDVHVAWLRQKLEEDPRKPKHILTVRGEGYRFQV